MRDFVARLIAATGVVCVLITTEGAQEKAVVLVGILCIEIGTALFMRGSESE